jgi:hypothetical protein
LNCTTGRFATGCFGVRPIFHSNDSNRTVQQKNSNGLFGFKLVCY